MAEMRGRYVYDGSLNPGRTDDGGWSGLLFDDDGKLADHAIFIPDIDVDDEPDSDPHENEHPSELTAQRVAVVTGVAVAAVAATVIAAPRVKRWWLGTVAPRLRRNSRMGEAGVVTTPLELTASPAEFSNAVDAAVGEPDETMSRAEAEQRLIAMLAAAAFIADQIRSLRNARFDDADMAELGSAMDRLTTREVADTVNRMLERDPALLDESTSTELMRIFGGGRHVGGHYVPIRTERVREALSLAPRRPDDEDDGPRAFVPF